MDNLTHTLVGASIASLFMGRPEGGFSRTRRFGTGALLVGAVVANLPDLDILIPRDNIIDAMTYHRGFSHSLIVETAAAPFIAYFAARFVRGAKENRGRFFVMVWLCLITHALLDSLTTYGTQLFWPLDTGPPVALASIFIIDPLFTLILLIGVLMLFFKRKAPDRGFRAHRAFFAVAMAYLAVGIAGHFSVRARAAANPAFRHAKLFVQPAPLTILYWQVLGLEDGDYETGVASLLPTCPVSDIGHYRRAEDPPYGAEISPSVRRLEWFTDGFYSFTAQDGRLAVTDLRIGVPPAFGFSFDIAEKRNGTYRRVSPVRAIAGLPRANSFGAVYKAGWRNLSGCLGMGAP
ncbi:MAG TPA: metal-dependent hydrolase [Alphaproteobacteria bacterium]|nr:metal-dependent hydrolase [Alphaproteobacteria bacterium]